MKNIKFIFSSLLVVTMMLSCNDATDIIQVGELSEEASFQSIADLNSGLSGAYSFYGIDGGGNGSGDGIYLNAILTDNLKKGVNSNGQGFNDYQYVVDISAGSPSDFVWANRYSFINQINRVLRASGNLSFDGAEAVEQAHINGQLYALRALGHLDLFEYFTVDYQNPTGLSIINVNFVPEIDQQLQRNTVAETIEFIRNDLELATQNLDPNSSTNATNIFVSQDFVDFMTIKLDLITGSFDSSTIALAEQLIANRPLSSTIDYNLMFQDAAEGESIFTLARGQGDNAVGDLFYFNQVDPDDAYLEVSNDLFNVLSELPGDVRLGVNVAQSISTIVDVNDADNLIFINKYPGSVSGPQINDIKLARTSEVLLMKAEMEARTGNYMAAQNSIKQLRDIRTSSNTVLPDYGNNLNTALTDIKKERRRELCFEGRRLLDIKRFDRDLLTGVQRLSVDCTSFEATCTVPANDYRYTLAIPQRELFGNRNITQNPQYPTNN
jgi:hypothetical protein